MTRLAVAAVVGVLALPSAGWAQSPADQPPAEASAAPATVDPTKLGVSLSRIRRELTQPRLAIDSPLRLEYRVEVFGQAPKLDFIGEFPLKGPMPGSAPTHREVVDMLTPWQFRTPSLPIFQAVSWAAEKLQARSRKQRCEAEVAEYRAMLMQGIAVAAPRCAR